MSYGYSLKLIESNKGADISSLGVQLGRKCIQHKVPVSKVARDLGVTRQSVYNWFCGASAPRPTIVSSIESFLASIQ